MIRRADENGSDKTEYEHPKCPDCGLHHPPASEHKTGAPMELPEEFKNAIAQAIGVEASDIGPAFAVPMKRHAEEEKSEAEQLNLALFGIAEDIDALTKEALDESARLAKEGKSTEEAAEPVKALHKRLAASGAVTPWTAIANDFEEQRMVSLHDLQKEARPLLKKLHHEISISNEHNPCNAFASLGELREGLRKASEEMSALDWLGTTGNALCRSISSMYVLMAARTIEVGTIEPIIMKPSEPIEFGSEGTKERIHTKGLVYLNPIDISNLSIARGAFAVGVDLNTVRALQHVTKMCDRIVLAVSRAITACERYAADKAEGEELELAEVHIEKARFLLAYYELARMFAWVEMQVFALLSANLIDGIEHLFKDGFHMSPDDLVGDAMKSTLARYQPREGHKYSIANEDGGPAQHLATPILERFPKLQETALYGYITASAAVSDSYRKQLGE